MYLKRDKCKTRRGKSRGSVFFGRERQKDELIQVEGIVELGNSSLKTMQYLS